ncbi:MAG: hypothetical protein Q9160_001695 [Pyrenula sp. 1 TL-2023]
MTRMLLPLLLLGVGFALADDHPITVGAVPTKSSCKDQFATTGTATTSTVTNQSTGGSVLHLPADFFFQSGASWEFSTDTQDIVFCGVVWEGRTQPPGLPKIDLKPDGKTFTIGPISPLQDSTQDITFSAGKKGQFCNRNNGRSVDASPAEEQSVRVPRRHLAPREDEIRFNFKAVGKVACNGAGDPVQPTTTNKDLASACSANKVSASAWSTLKVDDYVKTIISAAALSSQHNPSQTLTPTADVGSALASAAGVLPTICALQDKCETIKCSDVGGTAPKDDLSPVKMLAYNSYVGLSNMWNIMYKAVTTSAPLADTSGVFKTFFDQDSSVAWYQITSVAGPVVGILSGVLGVIPGLGAASAAAGAISGAIGVAGGIGSASAGDAFKAVLDAENSIDSWVKSQFFTPVKAGLVKGYTTMFSLEYLNNYPAIFGGGFWANFFPDTISQDKIFDQTLKFLTLKSINLAWKQSDAFIIFVRYGQKVQKPNKSFYNPFTKEDCEKDFKKGKDAGLIECNAGDAKNPGMARIYKALAGCGGHALQCEGVVQPPKGWDSKYKVVPDWTFDTLTVIRSSVASFLTGDFEYKIEDTGVFKSISDGKLDGNGIKDLMNFKVTPDAAGMFNIPVCEVYDLISFPLWEIDYSTGFLAVTVCGCGKGKTSCFTSKIGWELFG